MSPPPKFVHATASGIRSKLRDFLDVKTVILGLVMVGAAGATTFASMATKADVTREHDMAASDRLLIRHDVSEAVRRVDVLEEGNRWRDQTLGAIAAKLGVIVPPPPSSTQP